MRTGSVISFENPISVLSFSATVGKKEHEGPLKEYFPDYFEDEFCGQKTFEKAEMTLQKVTVERAIKKAGLTPSDIDIICGGDLLNQCTGSNYGLRDFNIPFVGMYGACSTMALSLINSACLLEGGLANHTASVTSSHFCSAERQFRYPLEYGNQRTPLSQWTVTGSGCVILKRGCGRVKIKNALIGRITDFGITDINNMGAAMAPAAADTIKRYLTDTGTTPADYDLILTGDLGFIGSSLLVRLLKEDGIDISNVHNDCGMMIYKRKSQDVHAGGSGCGCSASVLCAKILPELKEGKLKNVLFCATGALMSTTTIFQGESIPAIAHLVNIASE
jgi:stage V sporulation protein AD